MTNTVRCDGLGGESREDQQPTMPDSKGRGSVGFLSVPPERDSAPLFGQWQPMETAPRDGRCIFLLSRAYSEEFFGEQINHPPRCAIGKWNPEGTSWVDENGLMDGDNVCTLAVTGIWESGGGWFQPNEITNWMPLPLPNSADASSTQE